MKKSTKKTYVYGILSLAVAVILIIAAVCMSRNKKPSQPSSSLSLKQSGWSTVGSSPTCSSPWMVGTYYTVTVQDAGFPETAKTSVKYGPIVSTGTQTCPTLQIVEFGITDVSVFTINRASDATSVPAPMSPQPTINADLTFTDSQNPYSGPPVSTAVTQASGSAGWNTLQTGCTGVCAPWKTPTYYRMTYTDGVNESAQLGTSLAVGADLNNNNPIVATTPVGSFAMNVYRSLDNTTFSKVGQFDSKGTYTDITNPYQGYATTPSVSCKTWQDGSTCSSGPPLASSLICTTALWTDDSSNNIRPRPNGSTLPGNCTTIGMELSTPAQPTVYTFIGYISINSDASRSASYPGGSITTPQTLVSPITWTNGDIWTVSP